MQRCRARCSREGPDVRCTIWSLKGGGVAAGAAGYYSA